MARRKGKQNRTAAVAVLIGAAVLLLALIGAGLYMLLQWYNNDSNGATVAVPQLVGVDSDEVEGLLRDAQLSGRKMRSDYNDSIPTGQVYEQEPEAAQMVRPGRTVRYYVSLGKATFTVPNLIGETLSSAPGVLRKAGLRLGSIQRVYSRDRPAGRIVNQSPKLGEEFTSQVPVDVVVADSGGLPKVAMPDLYGLSLATVEETLTRPDLNLQLAVVEYVGDDNAQPGTVVRQKPAPSDQVNMAGKVEVQVGIPVALKAQPAKRVTIRIPIPPGPAQQLVKVKVIDQLGEKVEYSEEHAPGEVVERTVDVEGEARIQIFVGSDKTPLREERI